MDTYFFKELMDMPIYALAVALYIVGLALRKSHKISNKLIPIILTVLGVILILFYTFSANSIDTTQELCGAIFSAIVQGILCAAVAVYGDQLLKQVTQLMNNVNGTTDTTDNTTTTDNTSSIISDGLEDIGNMEPLEDFAQIVSDRSDDGDESEE